MNLALFDFDGTITNNDTFTGFIRFAVRPSRVLLGGVLLSPLALAYRMRKVPARRARPIVARVAFWGDDADRVRALGRRYASEAVPRVLRRRALERIHWHQQRGDRVVVVSASLDVYLKPWCESIGVERISTELEERQGKLTGRYCHGDCSGATKVQLVRQRYDLSRFPVVYAYGDTLEDREMLEVAHRKYYRWRKIQTWADAREFGVRHPSESVHLVQRDTHAPRGSGEPNPL